MNKKVVYYTLFMLLATILVSIGLLALLVIVGNLKDLLSNDPDIFIYEYERELTCSIISFCTTILGVDFLFMFILFFIFKKTRKKLKKEYGMVNKDNLLSKQEVKII